MTIAIELDESTYQHLAETARAHNLNPAELVKNLAIAYEESQRDQSKSPSKKPFTRQLDSGTWVAIPAARGVGA
jgi:hypothetical protein